MQRAAVLRARLRLGCQHNQQRATDYKPAPEVKAPVKTFRGNAKTAPSCGPTVEAPFPNPALENPDKFPPFSVPETRGQGSSLSRQLNATGDPEIARQITPGRYASSK